MTSRRWGLPVAAALVVALAGVASAGTVTITRATSQGAIRSGSVDPWGDLGGYSDPVTAAAANLGSWSSAGTNSGYYVWGADLAGDPFTVFEQRTAFEFSLAGLDASDILRVELRLTASANGDSALITGYTGNGTAELSDATNLGGTTLFSSASVADGANTYDITQFILGLLNGGQSYAGINLAGDALPAYPTNTSPRVDVYDDIHWNNSTAPAQLVVTVVPLPPAGWLGLALLAGLGVTRRLRRRRAG